MKHAKTGFFVLIVAFMLIVLSACTNGNNNSDEQTLPDPDKQYFSELLRTGEFVTAEQLETLKTAALSWQSARAGIGEFADIVVIEPSDGSNQQVYICGGDSDLYEKMQIQTLDGAQARIMHAWGFASSGELNLAYKFVTENSEWTELFLIYTEDLSENSENWLTNGQWVNDTEGKPLMVEWVNELPPDEIMFK